MTSYLKNNVANLKELLKNGTKTSVGLIEDAFETIEKNKDLNIFVSIRKEKALEEAKQADEMIKKGIDKALLGIPVAIKENIAIEGEPITAASKILETNEAIFDATVVKKLKDEGAIIVGTTNLDEFAMGSSTETSAHGVTKNPRDKERVPGGSSGGSAAAVSLGVVPIALGSDTGGSIRQPAAFCGCVGLKGGYGEVSRYGLYALASSLDVIGPITTNVADAELVFSIIKGKDKNDHTSIEGEAKNKEIKKIGVLNLKGIEVEKEITDAFNESVKKIEERGIAIETVELPILDKAPHSYYITQPAEASSNLARYDGIRYGLKKDTNSVEEQYVKTRDEGFGEETKRRILLGTFVLSSGYYDEYYEKAVDARVAFKKAYDELFEKVDLIICPISPTRPPKIGEGLSPVQIYANDVFTIPPSLAGIPSLSVPIGDIEKGIGIQLVAPQFNSKALFTLGNIIESIYGRN